MFVGPTVISGTIRPHIRNNVESLRMLKFKLHTYTVATPIISQQ